jgi:hypothetical protein
MKSRIMILKRMGGADQQATSPIGEERIKNKGNYLPQYLEVSVQSSLSADSSTCPENYILSVKNIECI